MTQKLPARASARKSLGEFKPLIIYPNGGTEVCEQSAERANQHTKYGIIHGNRYARGTTYATREEAIAAAQSILDIRRIDAERRYHEWKNIPGRENGTAHALNEARTWGSTL